MRSPTRMLLLVAAALAVGGLIYEMRQVSLLHLQLQGLQRTTASLHERVLLARQQRDESERRRQEAETDLAAVQEKIAAVPPIEAAHRDEIATWSQSVKKLKQLFEDRPAQRIPELRLLTESDWLRIAKAAEFNSEENLRKSMALVRDNAKEQFIQLLGKALGKFEATRGELPSSPLALMDFFDPPGADPAMLQRYETVPADQTAPTRSARQALRERSPVDEDYDARYTLQAGGGWGSSTGTLAWMNGGRELLQRAFQEFVRATGSEPRSTAQVLPYINPPLSPALTEKLLKADQERKR